MYVCVCVCACVCACMRALTRCYVTVLGRAIVQDVLDLEELIGPVPSDDGEAEAPRALPQGRLQQSPPQGPGVPREPTPTYTLSWGQIEGDRE